MDLLPPTRSRLLRNRENPFILPAIRTERLIFCYHVVNSYGFKEYRLFYINISCQRTLFCYLRALLLITIYRRSRLFAISSSVITQGFSGVLLGSSFSWASVKEGAARECSTIRAWISVSRLPIGPRERTKWPLGYMESTSQKSIRTTILCTEENHFMMNLYYDPFTLPQA